MLKLLILFVLVFGINSRSFHDNNFKFTYFPLKTSLILSSESRFLVILFIPQIIPEIIKYNSQLNATEAILLYAILYHLQKSFT